MEIVLPIAVAICVVGAAIGVFLPKFSAYFLGPVSLIVAVLVIGIAHKSMFRPAMTDGSPAGLLVPGIAWLLFGCSALFGTILVLVGSRGLRRGQPAANDEQF